MAKHEGSPNIAAGSLRRTWRNAGVPTDGVNGTYAAIAEKGDLLVDSTNGTLYQNTNTQASPTWTQIVGGAAAGVVGEMAASGTGVANVAGAVGKYTDIAHVHKQGDHDHSDNTKGNTLVLAAIGAGMFTADAAGRGKFANLFVTTALINDLAVTTGKIAVGALSADGPGRALFAAGVFDVGTFQSLVAAGILSANATGRAFMATGLFNAVTVLDKFAANSFDAAACAAIIADNAIPGSKVNWSYGLTPSTIIPDDSAAAGTSLNVARIDHVHANVCAAPANGSLAAANAEGASTSFARADHAHRAMLGDSIELEFGDTYDAVIGWEIGDAANHTLVLGLADANQALHVTDKTAIGTNWNVGADTHPSIYIHSDTTPATDYLKFYHDATTGYIAAVGGTLDLTGAGSVTVNEASGDVDFRVETNDIANGFVVDAGMNAFSFGAGASQEEFVRIQRPARAARVASTTYGDLWVAPGGTFTTENNTITYPVIASAYFGEPNITKGATDTITEAATVYIAAAPTEGAANYALRVAAGAVSFASTLACGGAITASAGISFADQSIAGTTGNLTISGAGYVAIGASPAASGYLRLPNAGVLAWRNQAGAADISAISVDAADDVALGADLQMGGNTIYGSAAANGDLTLAATSHGTVVSAFIIANHHLNASADGLATKVVAGAVGDASFTANPPPNGALAIDSTNFRIYFKYGAAWHYCAQTAGFEVNAEEIVCPACSKPLKVGQAVVGVLDSVLSDGALHGRYQHLKC